MKKIIYIFIILVIILLGYFLSKNESFSLLFKKPINTATYACNENKSINAVFYTGGSKPSQSPDMPPTPGGKVKISLSDGREMILPQTISASGVRYANPDESFVFWTKGNGALVLENNQEKSYIGCIEVSGGVPNGDFSGVYLNSQNGFTLKFPNSSASSPLGGFSVDEKYMYQASPDKVLYGVRLVIPQAMREGTNLSSDSYISVESIPQTRDCKASLFLETNQPSVDLEDSGVSYSVSTSTEAGLGNRYEETIYAIPGTNPCIAVRYFVHYSVIENYEPGTVKEFDKKALISLFDSIRRSLVVNQ